MAGYCTLWVRSTAIAEFYSVTIKYLVVGFSEGGKLSFAEIKGNVQKVDLFVLDLCTYF